MNAIPAPAVAEERRASLERISALQLTLNVKLRALRDQAPTPENALATERVAIGLLRCEQRLAALLGLDAPARLAVATSNESKFTLADIRQITRMLDEREAAAREAASAAAMKQAEVEVETTATPVTERQRLSLADLQTARAMYHQRIHVDHGSKSSLMVSWQPLAPKSRSR